MMKVIILFGMILLSVNTYASSIDNLNSALMTTINSKTNMNNLQNPFAIVYGGKDFSHPQIAVAHESIWAGRPVLIG